MPTTDTLFCSVLNYFPFQALLLIQIHLRLHWASGRVTLEHLPLVSLWHEDCGYTADTLVADTLQMHCGYTGRRAVSFSITPCVTHPPSNQALHLQSTSRIAFVSNPHLVPIPIRLSTCEMHAGPTSERGLKNLRLSPAGRKVFEMHISRKVFGWTLFSRCKAGHNLSPPKPRQNPSLLFTD